MPFSTFGLHADLLRGVKDLGFTQPTPIQKDAIPAALAGRDVLACSATGSGKTAAFLLPILHHLAGKPRGTTRALIVTPTRELAAQIDEHRAELARYAPVKSAAMYGGVSMGPQRHALERGVDILIATPGRLLDHLQYPYAKLNHVEILVLDEADRMLDMGFLPDIRRILKHLPMRKQTLFFSATLPKEIMGLTRELLKNPAAINLERQAKPATGISHSIYPVPHLLKQTLLLAIIRKEGLRNALVFTRTKRRADRVADYLKRNGVSATRIHGDRTQAQRMQALEGFKRGHYQVLVATDVAARGIDIDALSHVINFDMPGSTDDYIHRVGRTARADATGDAFTFVSPDEEGELKNIERTLACRIPRITVPDFNYTAPAPQSTHPRSGRGNLPVREKIGRAHV
jgi:ATP-dependent RNA helicase RhlE